MGLIQWVGIALLLAFIILLLREQKPLFATALTLAAGALLLFFLFDKIEAILQSMRQFALRAGVQGLFVETLLKIVGIAYITEFAAQTVRDAGLESIAAKVELAGKVFILLLAVPLLQMILDTILKLLAK
jgi:stage III sporulation protein AD